MNPYNILNISPDASEEEIKKAYKELAKKWHPDVNGGDKKSEEKFKEISSAYELLKNNGWKNSQPSQGFNISDIFGGFGGFNPFDMFNTNTRNVKKRKAQIYLSFEEAYNGCTKKVSISEDKSCNSCNATGLKFKNSSCSVCHGNGTIRNNHGAFILSVTCSACKGLGKEILGKCSDCNGLGKKTNVSELVINISAGTCHGTILHTEYDLDMVVLLKTHPEFVLLNDGMDVGSKAAISVFDAILGNSIDINTLNGVKKLKIPAGVQSNTVLKIKDGGFNYNGARGSHLVEVNIKIPINITEEQKELISKCKEDFEK